MLPPDDPCCELIGRRSRSTTTPKEGSEPVIAWNGAGWGVAWPNCRNDIVVIENVRIAVTHASLGVTWTAFDARTIDGARGSGGLDDLFADVLVVGHTHERFAVNVAAAAGDDDARGDGTSPCSICELRPDSAARARRQRRRALGAWWGEIR